MRLNFTLTKFRCLSPPVAENYPTMTLAHYYDCSKLPERVAIMRYDIEWMAKREQNTARIEQGICITYYFRMNGSVFQPEINEEIKIWSIK